MGPPRSLLHRRGKCKVTAQWKDDEQRFIYVRERALLLPKAHCGGMPQFFFFSFLIKTNCFLYRRGGELIRYNGTDISRKIRGRPGFFSLFYSQRDKRLAVLLHHAAKVCYNSGLCNTWAKTRRHIWDRKTEEGVWWGRGGYSKSFSSLSTRAKADCTPFPLRPPTKTQSSFNLSLNAEETLGTLRPFKPLRFHHHQSPGVLLGERRWLCSLSQSLLLTALNHLNACTFHICECLKTLDWLEELASSLPICSATKLVF